MELSEQAKGVLLMAARDSILSLFGDKQPPIIDFNYYPELMRTGNGTFVTITNGSELRGCIGYIVSDMPLFDTVCDAALQAASNDPRFYPLTEDELGQVNIEISILSELSDISSYDQIVIGMHGIVLEDEIYKAVLLPQVAVENNYDVPQFLTSLCEKAGLDPYAWETDQLNIKIFTTINISEIGNRKRTYEHG